MEADFIRASNDHFSRERERCSWGAERALAEERHALANRERGAEVVENLLTRLHLDLRGRRVLEVGSGCGGFVIAAAQKGASAFGIEADPSLHLLAQANALHEKGEITLVNGDLLDDAACGSLGGDPFDIIVLHDVLEHVYDTAGLFKRIAQLSCAATVADFAVGNGDCWQSIEREPHHAAFALTLLDPGSCGEVAAGGDTYYRPLNYYQLFFKEAGFRHLYLQVDREAVATAVTRVQARFRELEQRVAEGPFASPRLNDLAARRFAMLKQRLCTDLKEKSPLQIHLAYDAPLWQGVAARGEVRTLEHAADVVKLSLESVVTVVNEPIPAKPAKKRVVITIDVEASPNVQSEAHVDRLIWGKFGGEEVGIRRMMEVADRYGCKLTFFVDYCEIFRYPGSFEAISREIVERGHDLQLHAHMDLLPDEFWERHGLKKYKISLSDVDRQRAEILLDFLLESAQKMGRGAAPVAFRGGSFRYNDELLRQMKRSGVELSFNYNTLSLHQPNNGENLPLFRWDNGVWEVPMTVLYFRGWLRDLDVNNMNNFQFTQMVHDMIDDYYRTFPADSVAVMIMHSWSFCYTDRETRFKVFRDNAIVDNFERFLATLPQDTEIVTATGLHRLLASGELQTGIVRDMEFANKARFRSRML